MVLAGRVVLPVDGLVESHDLLVGAVGLVGGGEVLLVLVPVGPALAEPFLGVWVLLGRLMGGLMEVVAVLGQRALVWGHDIVVAQVEVVLEVPLFLGQHVARTHYLRLAHDCLINI